MQASQKTQRSVIITQFTNLLLILSGILLLVKIFANSFSDILLICVRYLTSPIWRILPDTLLILSAVFWVFGIKFLFDLFHTNLSEKIFYFVRFLTDVRYNHNNNNSQMFILLGKNYIVYFQIFLYSHTHISTYIYIYIYIHTLCVYLHRPML